MDVLESHGIISLVMINCERKDRTRINAKGETDLKFNQSVNLARKFRAIPNSINYLQNTREHLASLVKPVLNNYENADFPLSLILISAFTDGQI